MAFGMADWGLDVVELPSQLDVGCSDVLYLVEERTVEELTAILIAEEAAE